MFIEKAYLFQGMSPEFMDEISRSLTHESHQNGDLLFKAGDPAGFLYVIEEGRVRLSAGDRGIVTQIVENQGDAIGWSSLVGRDVYSSSAECLSDVRLVKIRRERLNEIFDRYPVCGLVLFRRLARMIGERLLKSYRQIAAAHESKGSGRYEFGG
ncbi:MAG: cyclic nucleotide-binding domain-containing protein [Acidobacteriia bacterium]|nr:cyclic nucleotide-binding domain-containing protein [Terriglobia bacterium]